MKAIAPIAALVLLGTCQRLPAQTPQRDYPVKPVPFTAVHVNDIFWAPRIEINRAVTIPFAFEQDERTGRVDNFIRAAEALKGIPFENHKPPGYPFDDTDVYKVIEGASYTLSVHPDPKLDAYLDSLIEKIGAAQEPDGYLYTARTIDPLHPHPWSGSERWILEGVNSHELYDLGHLYEAAVAHYQATGKRTLLDIALRTANLLDQTFGPGKREIWPGHQIVEMGLAKLYRVTGDPRYLNLAKFMLDARGPQSQEEGHGNRYVEAQARVVDQTEAVTGGHAVRAMYMYSGMADIAALTGDSSYVNALDKIWDNVAGRKLHVTGGVGARGAGEAFGADYELPNMSAYNETCAAVGNDYWNHRLFLLHADAKYIDVMERTLYNGLISGVALDGKTFFYQNPLEATGKANKDQRSPWFGVACCPGNITRFMASVPGYVYAQRGDALWVNLYMGSTADIKMDNGCTVKLTQQTRYPWDGNIKMTVEPDQTAAMTINVRIPGWARNQPIASDLYSFADKNSEAAVLKVNGKPVPMKLDKGYVAVTRTWKKGDIIELNLPMPIRRVVANNQVAPDRGRVALERGPIVYAAEFADNPGGKVRNLMLPDSAPLTAEFKSDLLKGVEVIEGKAIALNKDAQGNTVKTEQSFTAIPYYAWANRGRGEMIVWLPTNQASAKPAPVPTITDTAKITTSRPPQGGNRSTAALQDGEEPSAGELGTHFDWWPLRGATVWVQYDFDKPQSISRSEVFWFDDSTNGGGCAVPASWRLLYQDGDQWKPVENLSPYDTQKGAYNQVSFKPVTTQALRLELVIQPNWSAGIDKWHVD
ncbi:MAG TPA: beta-L-arabinofuranosidase domain-containing protein [Bryobacteraceae bacterium]|nr:beta-L-arabinofuranosidase domain-containing protein [Bryobacteraceae bacterium]